MCLHRDGLDPTRPRQKRPCLACYVTHHQRDRQGMKTGITRSTHEPATQRHESGLDHQQISPVLLCDMRLLRATPRDLGITIRAMTSRSLLLPVEGRAVYPRSCFTGSCNPCLVDHAAAVSTYMMGQLSRVSGRTCVPKAIPNNSNFVPTALLRINNHKPSVC